MASGYQTVVLLGAQRTNPTLVRAVSELGIAGKMATVTAGWQEREAEDDDLVAHLEGRAVNLRLHARAEEVFRDDPELKAAYHDRQVLLAQRQDFYRVRLEHALAADYVIRQRSAPDDVLAEETEASIDAVRSLDEWHLRRSAELHREFEEKWKPGSRPAVRRHREAIAALMADCGALAIAGGHVATLLNRLLLFGLADLARGKALFAWSGGAMVVTERLVLFHDDPPQGPGASEVLDVGLGLAHGVVALPSPEDRLRLDRKHRVTAMVRRFSPARCLAFPARSYAVWRDDVATFADGVIELLPDGSHRSFLPQDGAANAASPGSVRQVVS